MEVIVAAETAELAGVVLRDDETAFLIVVALVILSFVVRGILLDLEVQAFIIGNSLHCRLGSCNRIDGSSVDAASKIRLGSKAGGEENGEGDGDGNDGEFHGMMAGSNSRGCAFQLANLQIVRATLLFIPNPMSSSILSIHQHQHQSFSVSVRSYEENVARSFSY